MALSEYLPKDFDQSRPLALIAGQGIYPRLIADAARKAGIKVKLIAAVGETTEELVNTFSEEDRVILKVGQIGKMLDALEDFKAGYALMAGQITPRRLFHGLHPDLTAARILLSLKRKNAETIFGAIATEIEKRTVTLLDARSFMDEHLATAGSITKGSFPIDKDYIEHGITIARECAKLDIGQGCVVRKGTVLAVEAFEGTDEMIQRAGSFKTDEALFVKTVKTKQDYRFDVPCFGERTLNAMHEAGLKAAALEANRVILINKPEVITLAQKLGISLLGY
jgi:DUF1009 family protein